MNQMIWQHQPCPGMCMELHGTCYLALHFWLDMPESISTLIHAYQYFYDWSWLSSFPYNQASEFRNSSNYCADLESIKSRALLKFYLSSIANLSPAKPIHKKCLAAKICTLMKAKFGSMTTFIYLDIYINNLSLLVKWW